MADADLLERAARLFGEHLQALRDDEWTAPTAWAHWDVRTLVNHIAAELLWIRRCSGTTVEAVAARFAGDALATTRPNVGTLRRRAHGSGVDRPATPVQLYSGDRPAAHYLFNAGSTP